jgi:BMFP domain-containing protein YqiC
METLLGDEQAHRRVLAESLVRLKTELAGLQARVEALEARIGPAPRA